MSDKTVYTYTGDGAYISGIPARDLTAEDVNALPDHLKAALAESAIYRRVAKAKHGPSETKTED